MNKCDNGLNLEPNHNCDTFNCGAGTNVEISTKYSIKT